MMGRRFWVGAGIFGALLVLSLVFWAGTEHSCRRIEAQVAQTDRLIRAEQREQALSQAAMARTRWERSFACRTAHGRYREQIGRSFRELQLSLSCGDSFRARLCCSELAGLLQQVRQEQSPEIFRAGP